MAIPQRGPQNKLTKLYNHGHKILKRFTRFFKRFFKQIIATPKLTHIRSNKRYIAVFANFLAFPRPRSSKQLSYPLLICTSDWKLLPVTFWRHTGRRSVENNRVTYPPSHLLELKKCRERKKSSFIDLPVIETFRIQDENGYEYEFLRV